VAGAERRRVPLGKAEAARGRLGRTARTGLGALLALLSACTVGPNYHRPSAPLSAHYKEGWTPARPAEAVARGPWWSIYDDPVLDSLEQRIDISNQNLKAAEASFRTAEAIVAQARAGFFPTATASASAQRAGASAAAGSGGVGNLFQARASASWVPDLWGRVRRTVESEVASAQASAGDLANARLAAQAALAADYLQLRVADELKRLLDAESKAFAESLRITMNQLAAGTAAESDVAQAEAQLKSTQAQAVAVGNTRAQLEHAIAVLIGVPPAELSIEPVPTVPETPAIPAGFPSQLLERRPDIAAAERVVAAANAQIGVAESAFFPDLTLSADYGVAAATFARLLSTSSRVWSLGSDLVQTIFDAGARNAQLEQARATYDQTVAQYRQTVLTAIQQVEDALAAQRILAEQLRAQDQAVASARRAERIIDNQYRAGTIAYTAVIVAETTALNDAVTAIDIRQSRLTASVALIEALGGGWQSALLPTRERIEADSPLNFSPFPAPPKPHAP
jgi:NodT family efflux transporter outer membrane factor (OMF) lipoprotein